MTVVLQACIEHPPSWLRGMKPTSPEAVSSFNSFTNAYGRRVALAAQGRMSNMLRRKHRYEIGATEKAANNIEVAPGRMGKSFTSWDVVEGGLTPANEIIRSGMGPVQVKIETLYKWAIIKQLQLREYGEDATQARRIR